MIEQDLHEQRLKTLRRRGRERVDAVFERKSFPASPPDGDLGPRSFYGIT